MIYTVKISPKASDALFNRALHILLNGYPDTADSYYHGVYAYIGIVLSNNPKKFRPRDKSKTIRLAIYNKTTLIAYIVDDDSTTVTVIDIFNAREDYTRRLR